MSKNYQILLLFLLIPTIGELTGNRIFFISLPGFPLTLGRVSFIIVGLLGFSNFKNRLVSDRIFRGMGLMLLGGLVGALFSEKIYLSLSRSIGTLILFIASIGFAGHWKYFYFKRFLDVVFGLNFIYWIYYIFFSDISKQLSSSSYSELYLDQEVVNHHTIGIYLTVSCTYLIMRFFYKNNQLKIYGYFLMLLTFVACFITETRSNLLFSFLNFILIIYYSKTKFSQYIFFIIPIFIGMFLYLISIASSNEVLFQRFNFLDLEYQENTTFMRIEFIFGFFKEFLINPLGKGVFGAQISYSTLDSTMLHNQYLTFILSGGYLAFYGFLLWFSQFKRVFFRNVKNLHLENFDHSVFFSSFLFFVTLLTLEHSGLLFFISNSLLFYLSLKTRSSKLVAIH